MKVPVYLFVGIRITAASINTCWSCWFIYVNGSVTEEGRVKEVIHVLVHSAKSLNSGSQEPGFHLGHPRGQQRFQCLSQLRLLPRCIGRKQDRSNSVRNLNQHCLCDVPSRTTPGRAASAQVFKSFQFNAQKWTAFPLCMHRSLWQGYAMVCKNTALVANIWVCPSVCPCSKHQRTF